MDLFAPLYEADGSLAVNPDGTLACRPDPRAEARIALAAADRRIRWALASAGNPGTGVNAERVVQLLTEARADIARAADTVGLELRP